MKIRSNSFRSMHLRIRRAVLCPAGEARVHREFQEAGRALLAAVNHHGHRPDAKRLARRGIGLLHEVGRLSRRNLRIRCERKTRSERESVSTFVCICTCGWMAEKISRCGTHMVPHPSCPCRPCLCHLSSVPYFILGESAATEGCERLCSGGSTSARSKTSNALLQNVTDNFVVVEQILVTSSSAQSS